MTRTMPVALAATGACAWVRDRTRMVAYSAGKPPTSPIAGSAYRDQGSPVRKGMSSKIAVLMPTASRPPPVVRMRASKRVCKRWSSCCHGSGRWRGFFDFPVRCWLPSMCMAGWRAGGIASAATARLAGAGNAGSVARQRRGRRDRCWQRRPSRLAPRPAGQSGPISGIHRRRGGSTWPAPRNPVHSSR